VRGKSPEALPGRALKGKNTRGKKRLGTKQEKGRKRTDKGGMKKNGILGFPAPKESHVAGKKKGTRKDKRRNKRERESRRARPPQPLEDECRLNITEKQSRRTEEGGKCELNPVYDMTRLGGNSSTGIGPWHGARAKKKG